MFSISMWKIILFKGKGIQALTLLFADRRNGSSGWERRVVYKCICFGVQWLSASRPLWVCVAEWVSDRVPSALYKWIGVWGEPPKPASTWNTHFFTAPPSGDEAPPPRHPQIRILPAQLQWHMFMFIVLVCSSVKSRSKRRGRREEREE